VCDCVVVYSVSPEIAPKIENALTFSNSQIKSWELSHSFVVLYMAVCVSKVELYCSN